MPLSQQDRERARYHLGFPEVDPASSYQLGIPTSRPTAFLVEHALGYVMEVAVPRVRNILQILDNTEQAMVCAQDYLAAEQVGDLRLRSAVAGQTHTDLLEREYVRWVERLADVLGCPMYPYASRFRHRGGGGNIPVR